MARCKGCIHDNVCNRDVGHGYSVCPHYITADVVPRAELAREIFEEIEKIGAIRKVIHQGEIVYDVTSEYAELKKKYTDATDTNVGNKTKENKKGAVTDVPIQLSIFDKEDNQ